MIRPIVANLEYPGAIPHNPEGRFDPDETEEMSEETDDTTNDPNFDPLWPDVSRSPSKDNTDKREDDDTGNVLPSVGSSKGSPDDNSTPRP